MNSFWAVKKNKQDIQVGGNETKACRKMRFNRTGSSVTHIKTLGNYTGETFDKTGVLEQTGALNPTEESHIKTQSPDNEKKDCIFSLWLQDTITKIKLGCNSGISIHNAG